MFTPLLRGAVADLGVVGMRHACPIIVQFFQFHNVFAKNYVKQECIPVGCVPSTAVAISPGGGCLLPGGVCSGGVCSRGVSAPWWGGVCSQESGCVCSWGCLLWGVSAPGVCSRGWWYCSMHCGRHSPPRVDRQTPLKT